jgi:hypothetical protein
MTHAPTFITSMQLEPVLIQWVQSVGSRRGKPRWNYYFQWRLYYWLNPLSWWAAAEENHVELRPLLLSVSTYYCGRCLHWFLYCSAHMCQIHTAPTAALAPASGNCRKVWETSVRRAPSEQRSAAGISRVRRSVAAGSLVTTAWRVFRTWVAAANMLGKQPQIANKG